MKDSEDHEEHLIKTSPQSPNKLWRVVLMWALVLVSGLVLLNLYVMS